jgi:hypothetical protein
MEHRRTRQELYNRIWSTPMTRVAAELGTTTGRLSSLLRRAGIPTPSSGYLDQEGIWQSRASAAPASGSSRLPRGQSEARRGGGHCNIHRRASLPALMWLPLIFRLFG